MRMFVKAFSIPGKWLMGPCAGPKAGADVVGACAEDDGMGTPDDGAGPWPGSGPASSQH